MLKKVKKIPPTFQLGASIKSIFVCGWFYVSFYIFVVFCLQNLRMANRLQFRIVVSQVHYFYQDVVEIVAFTVH